MRSVWSAAAAVLLAGCQVADAPSDTDQTAFDRAAMIAAQAEHGIWPHVQALRDDTAALRQQVDGLCKSLAAGDPAAARSAAQAAWKQALSSWLRVDAVRVGPLAMDAGIGARIYSWPIASSCAVDQEVMAWKQAADGYNLADKLPNRKGLFALEALLFRGDLQTACPPQAAPAGWEALSDADKASARCGYAAVVAADVEAAAGSLRDAWDPAKGGYLTQLRTVGQAGNPLGTVREVTNALSDQLFRLEKEVRDLRVAKPAGVMQNSCGVVAAACVADLESPHAGAAKLALLAALDGFETLYAGNVAGKPTQPGFDDYLAAVGAGGVATSLADALTASRTVIAALPEPASAGLQDNRAAWVAAHDALASLTALLKTQFLTSLGLDLPAAVATDND
jgi:predicted lipoprotein